MLFVILLVLLIMFLTFAGVSAFLLPYIRRELEGRGAAPDVLRLQESIDDLTARITLLEEEKDFYRELRSSADTPQIESGPEV